MEKGIYISLGSNLPGVNGQTTLWNCWEALDSLSSQGILPTGLSKTYETESWPDPKQPWFINAVAEIETELPPENLLKKLQGVENEFGRKRGAKNEPRIIDLDLIDYRGRVFPNPKAWRDQSFGDFFLPHRRLHERVFVLKPLLDLIPDWVHPVLQITGKKLLEDLPSEGKIRLAKDQLEIP